MSNPSEIHLPGYIADLLHEVAATEGLENPSIRVKSGSNVGDGYISILIAVELTGTKAGGEHSMNLLVKTIADDPKKREELSIVELSERETMIYRDIFPKLEQFQKEKEVSDSDAFRAYPKCYAFVCDEAKNQFAIVMDDLRLINYRMWPKGKPVIRSHLELTLRAFAKFHAISFALKDQRPETFEDIRKIEDIFVPLLEKSSMVKFFEDSFDRTTAAMKASGNQHLSKYQQLFENWFELMKNGLQSGRDNEKFAILSHTDIWTNNTMFEYDGESSEPSSVSIIDWQLAHYNTPALDLLFYLLTSTDKQTRQEHWDALLEAYYSTFADCLTKLGSDPQALFSFENLQEELRRIAPMVFLYTPITYAVQFVDEEDLDNKSNDEFFVISSKGSAMEAFNKRVADLTDDLVELGYLFQEPAH